MVQLSCLPAAGPGTAPLVQELRAMPSRPEYSARPAVGELARISTAAWSRTLARASLRRAGMKIQDVMTSVRGEILAQHHRLRAQLETLRSEAKRAIHAEPGKVPDLPGMLAELLRSLEEHIAFEERQLTPLLRGRNPFGHRYAVLLLEDHVRQREELLAMAAESSDPDDIIALAMAVQAFVADVVQDMEDEELQFLTPHLLTDRDEGDETSRRAP
jgi:hypothetical protein